MTHAELFAMFPRPWFHDLESGIIKDMNGNNPIGADPLGLESDETALALANLII